MSDYLFMLESHLSGDQTRIVQAVRQASAEAGASLFLTGGAMRDILAGFPIRDLDFTVEGPALKIAKVAASLANGRIVSQNDHRKTAELLFPGGITAQVAMSRVEKYAKPGAKPQVTAAGIHDDLRGRDFTINAIAISLNRASRGLLIDPANGLADIGHRELRSVHPYIFYDDPVRLIRLLRFKIRFGFRVEARTQTQYENARLAEMETAIAPRAWLEQFQQIALELNPLEVLQALGTENLLQQVSPPLARHKANVAGFAKLQKIRFSVPFAMGFRYDPVPLFLSVLTEKLSPKERAALVKALGMTAAESEAWRKLPVAARKLEAALKSPKLQRASLFYKTAIAAPGEQLLHLLMYSTQRLVVDRIRNFFQKHLPAAMEITDGLIEAEGLSPGTPAFEKRKSDRIGQRLDARPPKTASDAVSST